MAKPAFASLFASSSSSSARHHRASPSSSTSSHPPLNRSSRSRPPDLPRTRTRTLALLAALSATPLSAHAYPLDPPQTSLPFLYPPFALEPTNVLAKRSAAPSTSNAAPPTTTGAPPSPSPQCQYDRADLPDKYVLGDDGYWHKTPWSLYGSAYCTVSKPLLCLAGRLRFDFSSLSLLSFRVRLHLLLQTMQLTTQEDRLPHLLMTLTSRPYQPVGLPFPLTIPPTVVSSSSSPCPWLSHWSLSSSCSLASSGDVNMHQNGIQKKDGEGPRTPQMTTAFAVCRKPKLLKENGTGLRPDGEITCGSLPIVGGRIESLPRLRAIQR
jgi:hypothetical protein